MEGNFLVQPGSGIHTVLAGTAFESVSSLLWDLKTLIWGKKTTGNGEGEKAEGEITLSSDSSNGKKKG